jgi:hypothetical protein
LLITYVCHDIEVPLQFRSLRAGGGPGSPTLPLPRTPSLVRRFPADVPTSDPPVCLPSARVSPITLGSGSPPTQPSPPRPTSSVSASMLPRRASARVQSPVATSQVPSFLAQLALENPTRASSTDLGSGLSLPLPSPPRPPLPRPPPPRSPSPRPPLP